MIQEDKLIEQLNNLKGIRPSDEFSRKLKGVVLSTPRAQKHAWSISGLKLSVKEGLGFALSVGVVAVLIVVFIDVTPKTLNPIIGSNTPGANSISMLNDANAAVNDIDIHMAEVNTFDAAAEQSGTALSSINPESINKEEDNINTPAVSSDASQVDNVLDQISK